MYDWGADSIERLRTLAAQGLSGARIAVAMGDGLTRSAVGSKLKREGIPLLTPAIVPKVKPAPEMPPEPGPPSPVTTLALQRGMCKWPVNSGAPPDGYLHCGAYAPHGPYCADHKARAFSKSHRDTVAA